MAVLLKDRFKTAPFQVWTGLSSDTKPTEDSDGVVCGALFHETDGGYNQYEYIGDDWIQTHSGGIPITAEGYPGTITMWEDDGQSTTRGTPTSQPTVGARVVSIGFLNIGSATADSLYVVFNAASDADANAKLAAAGSRYVVGLDERRTWTFAKGAECTRIDYLTETAETGENKVAGEYVI